VAPGRTVIEYVFQYGTGEIDHRLDEAYLRHWDDRTDSWPDRPFHDDVTEALKLLGTK
jgi:hypothetical protein